MCGPSLIKDGDFDDLGVTILLGLGMLLVGVVVLALENGELLAGLAGGHSLALNIFNFGQVLISVTNPLIIQILTQKFLKTNLWQIL